VTLTHRPCQFPKKDRAKACLQCSRPAPAYQPLPIQVLATRRHGKQAALSSAQRRPGSSRASNGFAQTRKRACLALADGGKSRRSVRARGQGQTSLDGSARLLPGLLPPGVLTVLPSAARYPARRYSLRAQAVSFSRTVNRSVRRRLVPHRWHRRDERLSREWQDEGLACPRLINKPATIWGGANGASRAALDK